ncbi:MAG: hypothetical protein RBR77_16190 [Thauera sp.]|jgi:hypothetical protein|nr:hypothetical protein [Thauera sp.]
MTRLRERSIRVRHLKRLWQADQRCHWCRQVTRLPPSPLYGSAGITADRCLPLATVDHLYSRLHPLRDLDGPSTAHTVLACKACNAARCRQENLLFRDFLRGMAALGWMPATNRLKVRAFREALARCGGLERFPDGIDGKWLAGQLEEQVQAQYE